MEKNNKHNETDIDNTDIENQADAQGFAAGQTGSQDTAANEMPEVIPDEEIHKLRSELDEQKDKYVRLFAEFDNYKRRSSKERIELIQTAGKEVIVSLLEVVDDCDRAEKQLQESNDLGQVKEGIQLVFNKFRKTLQAQGLKPMDSLHADFDVEKHEALTEIPVEDKKLRGKVVDVIQKGYYLNDKLIRFAKVVVGK